MADAHEQLRAFVDRVLRMKEEAKAINDDIREIYAEAKAQGYDKTVLGQVVSFVAKREKDPATIAEQSELFDLYLHAYEGDAGDEVETGTENALIVHTHEDHDAETGEILEHNSAPLPVADQAESVIPSALSANQSPAPSTGLSTSLAGVDGDADRHLNSDSATTADPAGSDLTPAASRPNSEPMTGEDTAEGDDRPSSAVAIPVVPGGVKIEHQGAVS